MEFKKIEAVTNGLNDLLTFARSLVAGARQKTPMRIQVIVCDIVYESISMEMAHFEDMDRDSEHNNHANSLYEVTIYVCTVTCKILEIVDYNLIY